MTRPRHRRRCGPQAEAWIAGRPRPGHPGRAGRPARRPATPPGSRTGSPHPLRFGTAGLRGCARRRPGPDEPRGRAPHHRRRGPLGHSAAARRRSPRRRRRPGRPPRLGDLRRRCGRRPDRRSGWPSTCCPARCRRRSRPSPSASSARPPAWWSRPATTRPPTTATRCTPATAPRSSRPTMPTSRPPPTPATAPPRARRRPAGPRCRRRGARRLHRGRPRAARSGRPAGTARPSTHRMHGVGGAVLPGLLAAAGFDPPHDRRRAGRARSRLPDRAVPEPGGARGARPRPCRGATGRAPTSCSPTTPTPTGSRSPCPTGTATWRSFTGDELGILIADRCLRVTSGRRPAGRHHGGVLLDAVEARGRAPGWRTRRPSPASSGSRGPPSASPATGWCSATRRRSATPSATSSPTRTG